MSKWFLSFHCRVPVGTLSALRCSGVETWMQALTTKPTSPGCLCTLTTEASMWRYRTVVVLFNSGETSGQIWLKFVLFHIMYPLVTLSSRFRGKMKVLFWLSTVSWTPCVSQSSPFTAGGSATSTLTLVSSPTSESWTGLTKLSSWCLTLVKNRSSRISPLFVSYQTSWRCWWAQTKSTMGRCFKSLVSWQEQGRVWWFSTPPILGLIPTTPHSATSLRRPAIWRSWTYFITANMNGQWYLVITLSQQQANT